MASTAGVGDGNRARELQRFTGGQRRSSVAAPLARMLPGFAHEAAGRREIQAIKPLGHHLPRDRFGVAPKRTALVEHPPLRQLRREHARTGLRGSRLGSRHDRASKEPAGARCQRVAKPVGPDDGKRMLAAGPVPHRVAIPIKRVDAFIAQRIVVRRSLTKTRPDQEIIEQIDRQQKIPSTVTVTARKRHRRGEINLKL